MLFPYSVYRQSKKSMSKFLVQLPPNSGPRFDRLYHRTSVYTDTFTFELFNFNLFSLLSQGVSVIYIKLTNDQCVPITGHRSFVSVSCKGGRERPHDLSRQDLGGTSGHSLDFNLGSGDLVARLRRRGCRRPRSLRWGV